MTRVEKPARKKIPFGLKSPNSPKEGSMPSKSPRESPSVSGAAGKHMKAAERETLILTEAIRFFAEHGFEGQTRELAKRVGIAHSALYRHFPSKDALIERVHEHVYFSRWDPAWESMLADRSRPLEDRLIQFCREYADRIFDYDWIRIFIFSGLRSYKITGQYLEIIREKLILPICRELRDLSAAPAAPISEREEEAVWGLHGQIFSIAIRKFVYGTSAPADLESTIVDHVKRFVRATKPDA
jgi:AcrR family transcriptional regulator